MAAIASLPKKLGVRAGHQVVLLGAPDRLSGRRVEGAFDEIGDVKVSRILRGSPLDTVMVFCDRLADLETSIGKVTERLHPDGQIWVAWRSRRAADVRQELVRRIGLAAGMVDTRVCSIDRVWSGMRLVISPENRDALAYRVERRGAGSGLQTARARRRS